MQLLIIKILLGVSALFVVLKIARRIKVMLQIKRLNEVISSARYWFAYAEENNQRCSHQRDLPVTNVTKDLELSFDGRYIDDYKAQSFTSFYAKHFGDVINELHCLTSTRTKLPGLLSKFIRDFDTIGDMVSKHNAAYFTGTLEKNKDFFDTCLSYPLDEQQRRSIVSEELNCLVVSSAGSGKTSSIVGKVKYLTEKLGVSPDKILLISYTNKAAAELTERIATPGLRGYTFHKLALDMIGQATGAKPSICDNTDALFVSIYQEMLKVDDFKASVINYFTGYQEEQTEVEKARDQRREKLSEQKDVQIKSLFPDMDGREVRVKSEQERSICYMLTALGVQWRYESPYEHIVEDEMHSQYKPDFSIYYEVNGRQKRIYLEHYAVNEQSLVPEWFAKDRGISYEEANQRYNDGITWKKATHDKFGTTLITTSSADFYHSDVKQKLKSLLESNDVPLHEQTNDELYEKILPKGSKQEKAFIRLVVTFITLQKSSYRKSQDILQQAKEANDKRGIELISKIFLPVYERYEKELAKKRQIDFNDAILQATSLCQENGGGGYEYIIVDEFQDISIDRYKFLKALREGATPARLYCVGDDWQSIYRFSGSDVLLFSQFENYFGKTDVHRIETTYRFGQPLVSMSSGFVQRNPAQLHKNIRPFKTETKTELQFCAYNRKSYRSTLEPIINQIPAEKSIFLLGRYSFDDYYLSFLYQSVKSNGKVYYGICGRQIEFLTVHKSKGLEADYVILLQCNRDTYGFPSLVSDDPVLSYVLTGGDSYPFAEERRLFYVAITRAKCKTFVMYDSQLPSVFVDEFLNPERQALDEKQIRHPNGGKRWTRSADEFLLKLYSEGKSIKQIAQKMGRSQTAIVMRLGTLKNGKTKRR